MFFYIAIEMGSHYTPAFLFRENRMNEMKWAV